MQTIINNAIEQINQGTAWVLKNVKTENEKKRAYKALVKERRVLKKIKNTYDVKATVALYGQSQCGKSHLVNLLLTDTGEHIQVNDRINKTTYDFLKRFNPPGGGESTGIITRFTIDEQNGITSDYPLHIKLMSIKDIVLLLCDGYYNDLKNREPFSVEKINKLISDLKDRKTSVCQHYLTEDDIREIEEYFHSFFSQDMYNALSSDATDYFGELSLLIEHLNEKDVLIALNMLWNDDKQLSTLCSELFYACKMVDFSNDTYVSYSEIDRTQGKTLLDVTWLERKDTTTMSKVYFKSDTGEYKTATMPKSNLATICSEIIFEVVPPDKDKEVDDVVIKEKRDHVSNILDNVDVLDFPGARARKKLDGTEGTVGEILRRGKVGYYFNKYTIERKSQILLFCWDLKNFEAGPMSNVIRNWIDIMIGDSAEKRSEFMNDLQFPPLFFVGTKYNDVLYQPAGETEGANFKERWDRWFMEQLAQNIIGVPVKDSSWLESWTTNSADFDNIYLLRDFSYSSKIFEGWDKNGKEDCQKNYPYPNYYEKLRESFLEYPFVKKHIRDAAKRWDEASEPNCDGSLTIARNLVCIVGKIAETAAAKNKKDVKEAIEHVVEELNKHYNSTNSEAAMRKACDAVARLQSSFDWDRGNNPQFFGNLMRTFSISEAKVKEVFDKVVKTSRPEAQVGKFVFIYMKAPGINPSNSYEVNLEILRSAYGFANVKDCEHHFKDVLKVDLKELFRLNNFGLQSLSQMMVSDLKSYYFDKYLKEEKKDELVAMLHEDTYNDMMDMLPQLFNKIGVDKTIEQAIHRFVDISGTKVDDLTELVADIGSQMINKFIISIGYDYYKEIEGMMETLKQANEQHHINLSFKFVEQKRDPMNSEHIAKSLALMDEMTGERIKQLLLESSEASEDMLVAALPGYRQGCRWRDLVKMGFVLTKDIPTYDIEANAHLGDLIEKCNQNKELCKHQQ